MLLYKSTSLLFHCQDMITHMHVTRLRNRHYMTSTTTTIVTRGQGVGIILLWLCPYFLCILAKNTLQGKGSRKPKPSLRFLHPQDTMIRGCDLGGCSHPMCHPRGLFHGWSHYK